jgi:hypothetical protein
MTTSTSSNRQTGNTGDRIKDSVYSYDAIAFAALYYPSLAGNGWDDELLPSGD